jgi:hypothetical protein
MLNPSPTLIHQSRSKTFVQPSWMPKSPLPHVLMDTSKLSEEDKLVITRSKSKSTPSPMDQIPYIILMQVMSWIHWCHAVNSNAYCQYLLDTTKGTIGLEGGIICLIGKAKAELDPSNPANFHPIALTSCIGKVFTSLVKRRWLSYLLGNKYLNIAVQKAFENGIPGCSEHL